MPLIILFLVTFLNPNWRLEGSHASISQELYSAVKGKEEAEALLQDLEAVDLEKVETT